MHDDDAHARLTQLATPFGGEALDLRLGSWTLRLTGLDLALAAELTERWGPFVEPCLEVPVTVALGVVQAGDRPWLPDAVASDNLYRLEAHGAAGRRAIVSHQFALGVDPPGTVRFKLGLAGGPELRGRVVENAVRILAANLALDHGGFAMHAAGVLHDGRAHLFAGPSRAGKTTAVAASAPAASLGDDFALVFRHDGSWIAPALPFDGGERIPGSAPRGAYPVAAIWRLYQAGDVRVERPSPRVAVASLLSCAAFPWVYPERAGALLDHVERYVSTGSFAHLHFARSSNLFSTLLRGAVS